MIATRARATSALLGAAFLCAIAGCGGGQAAPDGGDGHIDVDASGDQTEGGGTTAGIVVDTPSGTTATGMKDGRCDLLEAVLSASLGATAGDCANPNGATRIILQPGATYPVPKTVRLPGGTMLALADGVEGRATIAAAPAFAVDPTDPSSACLISIADGRPEVSLSDVTLTQDPGVTLSGVCVAKGALTVRRARVTGFRAGGVVATCLPASGCDHAVGQASTSLTVLNALIDGNRSARKGGGIASEGTGASLFIAHSAIVNNISDADGGGIFLGGGWGTDILEDCTISGNTSAGSGGGVLVRFAEMTNTYTNILTTTITNNTAAGTGGGIEFNPPAQPELGTHDVAVFASIVAGNYSPSTFDWNINAGWTPYGVFNCVNGSFIYIVPGNPRPTDMGGCTFDVRNPFLGPLMPFGGAGDLPLHPLLAGSPAVDGAVGDLTRDDQRDGWVDGFDPPMPAAWTIFEPLVDGDGDGTAVRDLGPYERSDRWQTELLAVRAHGPASHSVVTIPSGYDRGAGTVYDATSAANEFVTYALPIAEPGRYDVSIGARTGPDAGKFQVAIADDPAGPWTAVGPEQDGYAAPAGFVSLGPFAAQVATPGEKLVRFTVTGKNDASTGYRMILDFIQAKKSRTACPVSALSAGSSHTCAVMNAGGVRCWGANANGQLGDGGGAARARPPAVDVSDAATIASGAAHTCVLSSDGNVRCWGANANGQLGDGSTTDRSRPPDTDVLAGVQAIAAGTMHTCAVMTTGGVRCWGGNGSGQLGDGTTTSRSTPPPADVVGNIAAVSTGDTHTCALTAAGGVRCWGHNLYGELGVGNYGTVLAPPGADVLTGVKEVVAGNVFTCALTTGGGVRCWGYNSHGEIGDDTPLAADHFSPPATDILTGVASLAAGSGSMHVCARMVSGGLRCWGDNDDGQLGDGMLPIYALTPPTMDTPGFTGTCP